jgi:hypothetical protein
MKTNLYSVHAPAMLDQVDATFVAYLDSDRDADRVYVGMITEEQGLECPLVSYDKKGFTEQKLHSYVRVFIDTSIDFKRIIIKTYGG